MTRLPIPVELPADALTVIVDSREQHPWQFAMPTVAGTLASGDYSLLGLKSVVTIERKSLSDLLGCIGQERERFEREIQRLLAYPSRCIIVEADWADLERGDWRSKITPAAAVGSCLGWAAAGVPIILAGDRERAGRYAAKFLYIAARRRWREARALAAGIFDRQQVEAEVVTWNLNDLVKRLWQICHNL